MCWVIEMSLEYLKIGIKRISEIEVSDISKSGDKEVQNIISKSEEEYKEIYNRRISDKEDELQKIFENELAEYENEMKKRILKEKYNILEDIFVEVKNELNIFKKEKKSNYADVLKKYIVEGISKLKGENFIIIANREDKDIIIKSLDDIKKNYIENIKKELILNVSEDEAENIGGVIIYTNDMKSYYNNTFDAKLEILKRTKWSELLSKLFKEPT